MAEKLETLIKFRPDSVFFEITGDMMTPWHRFVCAHKLLPFPQLDFIDGTFDSYEMRISFEPQESCNPIIKCGAGVKEEQVVCLIGFFEASAKFDIENDLMKKAMAQANRIARPRGMVLKPDMKIVPGRGDA